jgi:uncharacterized protein YdeI (YjbR/CyaY-like superfamily)
MITEAGDYFGKGCGRCERFGTPACSVRPWAEGLAALRAICLAEGLAEVVKWAHPVYAHGGRNVAILGAFRGDFRVSFFDAALLRDPGGELARQGPNTRHPDAMRFTRNEEVAERAEAVRGFLRQAMANAEAGLRAPREGGEVELPDELVEALDADPELAEAFHVLTPGRQRSYAILLAGAKAPATRAARIGRSRGRILAGKGATEL